MRFLKHLRPSAFKTMSAAGKTLAVVSTAGIVAGAGLLLIAADERSVRRTADVREIAARQGADASIHTAIGSEIAARLAGDAAASKTALDYTTDAVSKESTARQAAFSLETAARQKAVADESAARQQALAAESAARQEAIAIARTSANIYTDNALVKESGDRQAAVAALQASVQAAAAAVASGQQSASAASATARQYTDSAVASEAATRLSGLNGLNAAISAERTSRETADAATLTSARQYADSKITSLQVYALSSVNIAIPTADAPTYFVWTSTCINVGDVAISGGIVYDYSRLTTGAVDGQTQAGVVRSEPDVNDPAKRTWIWWLRNTAAGSKSATFTLLCLDLTP